MKTVILIPASFVLSLIVWCVLSWPLPMHLTTAVAISAHGGADQSVRHMVPSDALQLLYYFQLVKEWVTGGTPLFYNLYEFNTGNDTDRYLPGGYYVPFSLIYTAGALIGGQAFGMNVAGLVSLWVSLLATWLFLRRYVKDEWVVALFSVFAIALPFRWMQLFDASPAGYAMMWVPLLLLGLDMAIRDGNIFGGFLAGLSVMMAFFADLHVFFFSCLLLPGWCVMSVIAEPRVVMQLRGRVLVIARAMLPLAVIMVVLVFAVTSQSASLEDTHMGSGRDLREVGLFSPQKSGFLSWEAQGISNQVHVGITFPILMVLGSLAFVSMFLRNPRTQWRNMLFWIFLLGGIAGIALLALGPHGLRSGGLFALVREVIPHYAMIRQAGKIFTLMPTLLALGGALALYAVVRIGPRHAWWRTVCIGGVGGVVIGSYLLLPSPTLSYLENEQHAYQAVVDDANEMGIFPRAFIVTLWPGDSHFGSIYQHYAITYRIRMINGYTPAIDMAYFEDVFRRFESVNQGYLSEDQIENLQSRGIRHLLVHEDIYPEKVAPFPVSYLLRTYLNHPCLEFLAQDGPVWAFRILDRQCSSQQYPESDFEKKPLFPARLFAMENARRTGGTLRDDEEASGWTFVNLQSSDSSVTLPLTATPPAPELRYLVRARGNGLLLARVHNDDGEVLSEKMVRVESGEWDWFTAHAPLETFSQVTLHLQLHEGEIDLDMALLTGGRWRFLNPGQSVELAAPLFFRAGYTDLKNEQVVFRRSHEEKRILFYGPRMPMAPGNYAIKLAFEDNSLPGTRLGVLHVELDWNTKKGPVYELIAGEDLEFSLDIQNNLPLSFSLVYFGASDLRIDGLTILRQ
ncbi:hypothetical protein [Desulfonatronum sp. SC1]|uniref:hypothetical protein n=1 Tax=Desulfonatronum sp. SC1 TaxID=2109626 RepID=UPI000D30F60F|nr:hypothetical protein [Desulfonatronum sp. SC1]PTN36521.1 hypothetical protein C6366_09360 [Desulfonatronum sp. SC1]